jgi:hypothetical protein
MQEGHKQHEDVLTEYIEELTNEGYRVIRLRGKSPDAVAVRVLITGELIISAVEVLGSTYRKGKGWHKTWTHRAKRKIYSMFDEVLIRTFKRDTKYQKLGPNPGNIGGRV